MPGLYRSPGMADIDVCFGKRQAGTEALKRTSQRYQDENAALGELLSRPRKYVALPSPGAYGEDDTDEEQDIWAEEGRRVEKESQDVETSDGSMHEGYGDRRAEETGLPPTPPEALSSDEQPYEPQPLFADGVRNALSSQKSGALSVTPVNPQLSPPTPDNTPPSNAQDTEPAIRREDTPEIDMLDSALDESQNDEAVRPKLESFQTAQEVLPVSEAEQQDQVYLPESDKLADHWLDETENKPDITGMIDQIADDGNRPAVVATDEIERTISPTPSRTRYRFESPSVERGETDWEKHISYVSGPDDLDLGDSREARPEMAEAKAEPLAGLGVSGVDMEQRQRSAENINNSVYRQIRQDNIRRESAISTNSGAIRAGIILPSTGSTPKSVRRRAKCSSLRDGPASESGERKRHSVDSTEHALKHERRHLPSRKALQESPVLVSKRGLQESPVLSTRDTRLVSSPARLGSESSRLATRALASKLASGDDGESILGAAHKLKRQSHGDRLSKNMSIRRTSQEVSPSDLEEAFDRIDRGAASVRRQKISGQQRAKMDLLQTQTPPPERQAQMNQGVKRSKVPSDNTPSSVRLRKVIPSIASEPDSSPSPRQVRHFSREERLENVEHLRRGGTGQPEKADKHHNIHVPVEHKRQSSSDTATKWPSHDASVLSSPRKSLDSRFLQPTTTPMSASGFSDRTADIEVCEASGVRIYPHNNNSLLVVQQGSRPASKDKHTPDAPSLADVKPNTQPLFAAQVDPPTPVLGASNPNAHVDSPLTNPRAAPQPPEPPSIQFIPPTPNEELERELMNERVENGTLMGQVNLPGRSLSFKQKFRRYSDSFFSRSTSFRKASRQIPPRDNFLSPMWQPQRFWDDYDSEDDYHDDYEPEADVLPPGGDTSHFDDDDVNGKNRSLFPRVMSKRLPGFRGKGGFLQGNSLGIDRHGTNNRRHYVSTTSRTLSKRASEELLQGMPTNSTRPLSHSRSYESMSRLERRQRGFKVPFTGGMRAKWVGTQAFRQKMREARVARDEREREKRREQLKGQIGMRVYHG